MNKTNGDGQNIVEQLINFRIAGLVPDTNDFLINMFYPENPLDITNDNRPWTEADKAPIIKRFEIIRDTVSLLSFDLVLLDYRDMKNDIPNLFKQSWEIGHASTDDILADFGVITAANDGMKYISFQSFTQFVYALAYIPKDEALAFIETWLGVDVIALGYDLLPFTNTGTYSVFKWFISRAN